jgi:hypothetical protein
VCNTKMKIYALVSLLGNNFYFGIFMKFKHKKLQEQYTNYWEYFQFVQHNWLKEVEDFLKLDYEL